MATNTKVAFIGTGIMGEPIAEHILDAGYDLTVYNRTEKKAEPLIQKGAHWAPSAGDAAKGAGVIFTMLGYPDEVEDTYLTKNGLIRRSKKGAYLIDLTTSSPQLARDIHDSCEIDDKHAFDCPVTGGEGGAKAGTLTLIIGATEDTAEPVLPILKTFSKKIYYFDEAGRGQIAKLCNQICVAANLLGGAEALALARRSGLDQQSVLDMISDGMGSSRQLEQLLPKAISGDYRPGFKNIHLRKDLALALRQAEEKHLEIPQTEAAFSLFDTLVHIGGAKMGTQAASLLFEDDDTTKKAGLDWALLDEADDPIDPDDERAVQQISTPSGKKSSGTQKTAGPQQNPKH